jgi:hypothetical protein
MVGMQAALGLQDIQGIQAKEVMHRRQELPLDTIHQRATQLVGHHLEVPAGQLVQQVPQELMAIMVLLLMAIAMLFFWLLDQLLVP